VKQFQRFDQQAIGRHVAAAIESLGPIRKDNRMSDAPSFQELLADFSAEIFVGRGEQLALFQQALTAPRPPFLIMDISGQGGVGKTTLLEQFRRVAGIHKVLTGLVNEDQIAVPEALATFAQQFGEAGYAFKVFNERYHKYRKLKEQVETDQQAPKGLLDFALRGGVRAVREAVRPVPIAGGVADVVLGSGAEDILAGQVSTFAGYVAQKFGNKDERVLLLETDQELTRHFLADLNKHAQSSRIVLLFDTYEKTAPYLEPWLLDMLGGKFGAFSGNVLFVIAGRYPLGQAWTRFRKAIRQVELREFTEAEACEYLARSGITDGAQVAQLLKLSDRLPVLLAFLISAPGDVPADVSGTAVERFLQGAGPEQREVALTGSVTRYFNQDVLSVILGAEAAGPAFEWLTDAPFVRPITDGWTYHEVVRSLLLRYFRLRSSQRCAELHGKMAQYYATQAEALSVPEKEQRENERWCKCEAERLYHRLSQNPVSGLGEALSGFLANYDYSYKPALRSYVDTLVQVSDETNEAILKTWAELLGHLTPLPTLANRNIPTEELQKYISAATFLCDFETLESRRRSQAYYIRGAIHWIVKNYSAALADCSKAIEFHPEDGHNYYMRGSIHAEMKDYPAALADFSKVIDLQPEDGYNYPVRGDIYRQMKDYPAALADYTKAIELLPQMGYNYSARGMTRSKMKDYAGALADLSKAIDLEPKDPYCYAFRGLTYLEWNDASNAQADFAQVETYLSEEGGSAYRGGPECVVASGYAAVSQITEACTWLRRAFERNVEWVREARIDADLDPIRETAEFKALMAEFEGKT
jgi:tetratricopeptide (TPR) repeat protein